MDYASFWLQAGTYHDNLFCSDNSEWKQHELKVEARLKNTTMGVAKQNSRMLCELPCTQQVFLDNVPVFYRFRWYILCDRLCGLVVPGSIPGHSLGFF
jgi:hypothetical protein